MNSDTCAVLTAVFPLVLVTVVVERRTVHAKIGLQRWYRGVIQATVGAALVGLVLSVIGVQTGGLVDAYALFAWLAGAVAIAGLAFALIASIATHEVAEDAGD